MDWDKAVEALDGHATREAAHAAGFAAKMVEYGVHPVPVGFRTLTVTNPRNVCEFIAVGQGWIVSSRPATEKTDTQVRFLTDGGYLSEPVSVFARSDQMGADEVDWFGADPTVMSEEFFEKNRTLDPSKIGTLHRPDALAHKFTKFVGFPSGPFYAFAQDPGGEFRLLQTLRSRREPVVGANRWSIDEITPKLVERLWLAKHKGF